MNGHMKRKTNLIVFAILISIIASLGLTTCGSSKKIKLKDVYVTGVWKEFIEVTDGECLLENISFKMRVSLSLKLIKTYTGDETDPSATFGLTPLSKGGAELGKNFQVESRDRFNEFIMREPGATANISFVYPDERLTSFISKIKNFEVVTIEPKQSSTGATRTVAVPELTGKVEEDVLTIMTGAVTTGLVKNPGVKAVVDQNQITAIRKQHNFQLTDWADTSNYAEIGKVLNVDTIAIGTVTLVDNKYHISLQLVDINTFAVVGSFTSSYERRYITQVDCIEYPSNLRIRQ